ncbi:hypothetical protein CYMTET_13984 [Cymbomonas tetramitiformis]|uniref:Uncharacterized protein n=1 Tax=Cymbomonas tetramitiformis TaxID=36881 RepID=A0AAE0GHA2_9CHLO|nr:hypothetical protein CYMTET_13984 [Cymbomonas tetramitiformis]
MPEGVEDADSEDEDFHVHKGGGRNCENVEVEEAAASGERGSVPESSPVAKDTRMTETASQSNKVDASSDVHPATQTAQQQEEPVVGGKRPFRRLEYAADEDGVTAICKRTRANWSLAEKPGIELKTPFDEDAETLYGLPPEEEDFPFDEFDDEVDYEDFYKEFLNGLQGANEEDEEDEDDVDYEETDPALSLIAAAQKREEASDRGQRGQVPRRPGTGKRGRPTASKPPGPERRPLESAYMENQNKAIKLEQRPWAPLAVAGGWNIYPFRHEQLMELHRQVQDHVQLLIQLHCLTVRDPKWSQPSEANGKFDSTQAAGFLQAIAEKRDQKDTFARQHSYRPLLQDHPRPPGAHAVPQTAACAHLRQPVYTVLDVAALRLLPDLHQGLALIPMPEATVPQAASSSSAVAKPNVKVPSPPSSTLPSRTSPLPYGWAASCTPRRPLLPSGTLPASGTLRLDVAGEWHSATLLV